MSQNDFGDNANQQDADLTAALKGLPVPAALSDLQQRVRVRIRVQRVQRQVVSGLRAAVVLLVVVLFCQVWINSTRLASPAAELSAAELDFLFAPPPVDPLAVLDQQQQVAYRALQRWESNR